MIQLDIYQVDAFTDRLFGGNPAAVVPLHQRIEAGLMQQIAMENNLAETAFFLQVEDTFELRWFTPALEVNLCGHATVAAAHVLWQHLDCPYTRLNFLTKSGELSVQRRGDLYVLDFPAHVPYMTSPHPELIPALGIDPVEVMKAGDYYLLVYESEGQILQLMPNMHILLNVDDALGIIATARGSQSDFVSRFFAPRAGIPEDPVTGSAHCSLTPYWSQKLNKKILHAYQLSARRGELFCEWQGGDRVGIAGMAVTYMKGNIFL